MATPYERTAPADAPPRRTLVRPRDGRWLAGVCVGVAHHLGINVRYVRIAMVALTVASGAGVAAYLFLWALTPEADVEGLFDPAQADSRSLSEILDVRGAPVLAAGGLVIAAGVVWGASAAGLDVRANVLIPLLVITVGAVLAWSQLDEAQRGRWLESSSGARGPALVRIVLGLLVAVIGLIVLVTRGQSVGSIVDAAIATLAVLAGAVLIAAPWAVRLVTDLRKEQVAAARANERADIAAHLHDSVLQTLALIQRTAEDPAAVSQLARAQERELRSWLYAGPTGSEETLASAVAGVTHEVEDLHGIPIDLVVTGDRKMEPHGEALVRALREALLNAVRHARPPVSAYVEVGPGGVEAFVRDHGEGFDAEEVPEDRLGVRESILGRMERHGGGAKVRRLDEGTEVELTLPPNEGEKP